MFVEDSQVSKSVVLIQKCEKHPVLKETHIFPNNNAGFIDSMLVMVNLVNKHSETVLSEEEIDKALFNRYYENANYIILLQL